MGYCTRGGVSRYHTARGELVYKYALQWRNFEFNYSAASMISPLVLVGVAVRQLATASALVRVAKVVENGAHAKGHHGLRQQRTVIVPATEPYTRTGRYENSGKDF